MDWLSLLYILFSYDHRQQQWIYLKARLKESSMHQHHIFIQEWTSFIRGNLNAKERKQISEIIMHPAAVFTIATACSSNSDNNSWVY